MFGNLSGLNYRQIDNEKKLMFFLVFIKLVQRIKEINNGENQDFD